MSRDTQAPSSPTTEAGTRLLDLLESDSARPFLREVMVANIMDVEAAARDEGRREAVRYIREGLLALKSDSGVLPHGTIRLQGLLDECLGVAGLNASESPPTILHDESCCWPDQFRGAPHRDCPGVLALKDMRGDASESGQPPEAE